MRVCVRMYFCECNGLFVRENALGISVCVCMHGVDVCVQAGECAVRNDVLKGHNYAVRANYLV